MAVAEPVFAQYRQSTASSCSCFILKPADSCKGKGIRLISRRQLERMPLSKEPMVVQEYLTTPKLCDERKVDFRYAVLSTVVSAVL